MVTGYVFFPSFFSFVVIFDDDCGPEEDKWAGRHKMHFSVWVLDTSGFLIKILVRLTLNALCV